MMMRARVTNLLTELLWEVLALAVMSEGVGIKLALYSPTASPEEHFGLGLRLTISLPIIIVYLCVIVNSQLLKNGHHYDLRFRWVSKNKAHAFVLGLRLGLLGAMFGFSWLRMRPSSYVALMSGMTLLSTLLLNAQEVKYQIRSENKHPLANISEVLNGMRIKARRRAPKPVRFRSSRQRRHWRWWRRPSQ